MRTHVRCFAHLSSSFAFDRAHPELFAQTGGHWGPFRISNLHVSFLMNRYWLLRTTQVFYSDLFLSGSLILKDTEVWKTHFKVFQGIHIWKVKTQSHGQICNFSFGQMFISKENKTAIYGNKWEQMGNILSIMARITQNWQISRYLNEPVNWKVLWPFQSKVFQMIFGCLDSHDENW